MTPFLQQVARHYLREGNVSECCFVFPNRRSMVFFRKWLSEGYAALGAGSPMLLPAMMTVNDFFSKVAGAEVPPKVDLLLDLYSCYRRLNPKAEELDEFIFWGDILLGDFDDVDKYLVDARQLFTNVGDLRALQDDFSYLTDRQKEAMEKFLGHFTVGRAQAGKPGSRDAKVDFARIWNILLPLYTSFRGLLASKGMAYEGMTYRSVADRLGTEPVRDVLSAVFPRCRRFVFVGLNALNECEKSLLAKARDAGIAEFCWDWPDGKEEHWISAAQNKAGFFMHANVAAFPQAFRPEGFGEAAFKVLSVPSSIGQAKQLPEIFRRVGLLDGNTPADAQECAVVLPDEGLLIPVLNSIPEEIPSVNVTMGFPLKAGEFSAFMSEVTRMQLHLRRRKDGEWSFYHKQVWNIFASPVFSNLLENETMAGYAEKVKEIRTAARYYVRQSELSGNPVMESIFTPVGVGMDDNSPDSAAALADYQQSVIAAVAPYLPPFEAELAKRWWTCVSRLKAACVGRAEAERLAVLPVTYCRLVESLVAAETVPFRGEPLSGLQIMGPLETRALDFRNVAILSSNEGIFPRRSVSSSFIPAELRKGFGLPTYEHQDAVWAYYFYRLVGRAENVWMLYDCSTGGMKGGEESRYIKQLRYDFHAPVETFVASFPLTSVAADSLEIPKTEEDIAKIRSLTMSASAIQSYLACPAQFYFRKVKGLEKEQEVAESLDAGMLGTVYHNTMQALMHSGEVMLSDRPFDKLRQEGLPAPQPFVTREYLEDWAKRDKDIRARVLSFICAELHTDEVSGRDLVTAGVITRYVRETIARDLDILKAAGKDRFEVLGLEMKLSKPLFGRKFFGVIDRLDSLGDGVARVVDYKSGGDNPKAIEVDSGNAAAMAASVFAGSPLERHSNKAALQFYIYDRMLEGRQEVAGKDISNSMYKVTGLFSEPPVSTPMCREFIEEMDSRLEKVLDEMEDPEVGFARCNDEKTCQFCDFKAICGK